MPDSLGEFALQESFHPSAGSREPSPPPELNPIQNPLLAENLGRWAQVYFTAEPEKRDQAVRELLLQLQSEYSGSRTDTSAGNALRDGIRNVICPACRKNNSTSQRFCGFCGMQLEKNGGSDSLDSENPSGKNDANKGAVAKIPHNGFSGTSTDTDYVATDSGSSAVSSLPDWPASAQSMDSPELASLRQVPFSSAYDEEESAGRGWKYAIAVLVVVGLLSALAYLQWGNTIRAALGLPPESSPAIAPLHSAQTPSNVSDNSVPNSSQPALPPVAATQSAQPSLAQSQPSASPSISPASDGTAENADHPASADNNPAQPATASPETMARTTPPAASSHPVTSAAKTSHLSAAAHTSAAVAADSGVQELLIAQNYLNGTPGTRNPAIAVQWLWKAVGKQNATALVLLSDLYMQGEGVSKNCTQARLLLVAAAKQGEPSAGPKLRSLESSGCH